MYFPDAVRHPRMRLRKLGESWELTKKVPVVEGDGSRHYEYTIQLDQHEYAALAALPGKKVHKRRYAYQWQGRLIEIDVFLDDLAGLVLADAEFSNQDEFQAFIMPEFCLVDVTNEKSIRGGELCGRAYSDIESVLAAYGYKRLIA